MIRTQIIDVLRGHGFCDGRCIAHSKTGYCKRNRGHFTVFNAQVFTRKERILQQADLDLTRDADRLNAAARVIGQNLYVLHEGAPRPFWEPGSTSMREVLWDAIWWTRIHSQDKDVFLPVETALRRPRRLALVCSVGRWRGQPAYNLNIWENENLGGCNMFGAAVELCGWPPRGLRRVRNRRRPNDPPFMVDPSPSKGRPVRPVFCQRSGPFEFIWFSHGQAVPAVLWDHSVGLLDGLRFTWHKEHGAIHVHRNREVSGFIWACSIYAPEVVATAKARLRLMSEPETTEAAGVIG
jgi:hypothetical protein